VRLPDRRSRQRAISHQQRLNRDQQQKQPTAPGQQQPQGQSTGAQQGQERHNNPGCLNKGHQPAAGAGAGGSQVVTQGKQHSHEQASRRPATVIHMFNRNGWSDGIDLQTALPGQNSQPDRCADHGIDKQDDQHRMHERQPLQRCQRLQSGNQGNTSGQN